MRIIRLLLASILTCIVGTVLGQEEEDIVVSSKINGDWSVSTTVKNNTSTDLRLINDRLGEMLSYFQLELLDENKETITYYQFSYFDKNVDFDHSSRLWIKSHTQTDYTYQPIFKYEKYRACSYVRCIYRIFLYSYGKNYVNNSEELFKIEQTEKCVDGEYRLYLTAATKIKE